MVPLATGSDGGGSIRIPSALVRAHRPQALARSRPGPAVRRPPGWADFSTKGVDGPPPRRRRARPRTRRRSRPDRPALAPGARRAVARALDDLARAAPGRLVADARLRHRSTPRWPRSASGGRRRSPALGTEVDGGRPVSSTRTRPGRWFTLAQVQRAHRRASSATPSVGAGRPRAPGDCRPRPGAVQAVDVVRAQDARHTLNLRLVELFHQAPLLLSRRCRPDRPLGGELGTIEGDGTPAGCAFTYPFNMTRSPAGTVCAGFTSTACPSGCR